MNINDITLEQIGAKFIEWVEADSAHQKARKALYFADFSHVNTDDDYQLEKEFKTPNQPYRGSDNHDELIKNMHLALIQQNKVYDELMLMTDLFRAKTD